MKNVLVKSLVSFILITSLILGYNRLDVIASEASDSSEIDLSGMYRRYDLVTGEISLVSKEAAPTYVDGQRVVSTDGFISGSYKQVTEEDRNVIGGDTRTIVNNTTDSPYYGIGRIVASYTDGTSQEGTGFLVSKNVMLTNGHMCMSPNNASISSMTIYFGQNGSYTPVTAYASSYYVCANYNYFGDDVQDDYAIVILSSNVGYTTGWFGLDYKNNSFFFNNTFTITGYPGEFATGTMYRSSGTIYDCSTYVLEYFIDTSAGQSGAPIYQSNVAYGIHSSGTASMNYGRRMTQEVFDWLVAQGFVN